MPANEQRGHFGLSSSGGGRTPASAAARRSRIASSVLVRSASSRMTGTRSREPAYQIAPRSTSYPLSSRIIAWTQS